jgi:GNAT superfamily N-acetyltransferase
LTLEIIEVRTKRELKTFIDFPYKLYRNSPYWVPPIKMDEANTLRKDKNPAFDHCEARYWLAKRDGKVVGRIAGIVNKLFIEKWKKRQVRFGWIDFVDDLEVSGALLNAVESWARELGMTAVHGPLGFTDMDYEGMLVEGFDELGTMVTIYNAPYYPVHMAQHGYLKDADWVEFEMIPPNPFPPVLDRIAASAEKKYELTVLRAKKAKEVLPYAGQLFDLINVAYADLYGVVELTEKQIKAYTKQYFGFIRPEFVPILLDKDGKMAAFGITMPSLTRALQKARGRLFPFGFLHLLKALKKNDRADLYLVAVRPEFRGKGVNAILIREMQRVYTRLGITKVESNPELETNSKVQSQWKFIEKRQHKRRRCFIKPLS